MAVVSEDGLCGWGDDGVCGDGGFVLMVDFVVGIVVMVGFVVMVMSIYTYFISIRMDLYFRRNDGIYLYK